MFELVGLNNWNIFRNQVCYFTDSDVASKLVVLDHLR